MAYDALSDALSPSHSLSDDNHSNSSNYSRASHSDSEHLHDQASRPVSPDLETQSLYSDVMDRPRTVSREGSILRHPTPDLQSIQGGYLANVERLEQSAERLSSSSDIGEELRKIKLDQRRSESRRSSVLNTHSEDGETSPQSYRQTSHGNGSYASNSNSIVNLNNVARSGGFSPTAYFASPRSSVRSGSRSHHNSFRGRSASYGSRLAQLPEPEQEGKPLDSVLSTAFDNFAPAELEVQPLRVTKMGDFNLDNVEIPHTEPEVPEDPHDTGDRRVSTDTYRQATNLFTDFDGVHIASHSHETEADENVVNRRASRQPSMLTRPMSYMEPLPGENMVYYPAPVPMMLNLPTRLSKLPSAPQRDKRRSELLGGLPAEARQSAAWLPDMVETANAERHTEAHDPAMHSKINKRRTIADLPPQLRASMFFDYPSASQDVQVKGDSAVATLDSILDASAYAPVSAFTDHPFAGQVGPEVYGKAPVKSRASVVPGTMNAGRRRSTINLLSKRNSSSNVLDDTGRRRSINLLTKRKSSSNLMEGIEKRNSSMLSLGHRTGERRSSGQQFEDAAEYHEVADNQGEVEPLPHPEDQQPDEEADFHDAQEELGEEQQAEQEDDVTEDFAGAPSTLLAELQLRKEQQKLRTRTAATAYPQGMHSTLLQLDAVAQVQKQARRQRHTKLAWEDPNLHPDGAENEDDEDVPLGMLFPGNKTDMYEKSRLFDEDRPLGLIAKRDMEDNEPLSHRRARLRGEDRKPALEKKNSMYTLNLPAFADDAKGDSDNDHEDETLAQRIQRLKATQNKAQPRPVSGDFASEVMSQFGGLPQQQSEQQARQGTDPVRATTKTPDLLEDETLAQRRKRLQAEASKSRHASGDSGTTPAIPPATQRRSMADILQAHPAAGAGVRSLSNELKFAPAPATRNTPWAINQTRKASMGPLPMASGTGIPTHGNGMTTRMNRVSTLPNPGTLAGVGIGGNGPNVEVVDARQRDMIDRWRQSVMY